MSALVSASMLGVEFGVNQKIFIESTTTVFSRQILNAMETELIRTFLEVKECRHFGKAAENLYLTQAAVSSRIRQLEQYFGTSLFHRNRNNIQLTEAGSRLIRHAEEMLQALQAAKDDINGASTHNIKVSIAATPNTWDAFAHDAVTRIYAAQPQWQLQTEILSREQMTRKLLERTLDIGVLFDPPKVEELRVEQLQTMVLEPVTTFTDSSEEAPLGMRYIHVDWGSSFGQWHAKKYRDLPPPAITTSTGRIALDLLLQSGGSAYLPSVMTQSLIQAGQLKRIETLPVFSRELFIAYHRNNENEVRIQEIKQLLCADNPLPTVMVVPQGE